jgi:hypothetical protein
MRWVMRIEVRPRNGNLLPQILQPQLTNIPAIDSLAGVPRVSPTQ